MPQNKVPHVLVVDDEQIIATTLAMILKQFGYSTDFAFSGEEAIEKCRLNPPDMLISDVVMPGINGFELAMLTKVTFPNCNVLLISGHTNTSDFAEIAQRSGPFELLPKPVHPSKILERVQKLCPLPPAIAPRAAVPNASATAAD